LINELKAMAIFAEVIDKGSFRAAAKELALSPSVVSYHISQLEARVGTALIYRSTRHLSMTSEGQLFYQHVTQMMQAAKQGIEQLSGKNAEPVGHLNLSLPSVLSQSLMIAKIVNFAKKYPKVILNLRFTDNRENVIEKGIDLALRAGHLEDSNLKSKSLGNIKRSLVCAPEFYKQHKKPTVLEDIASWHWIKLKQLANTRTFYGPDKATRKITFNHQVTVNNVGVMSEICQQGMGLATLAADQADDLIATGKLIHVLPQWQVEPIPLYAVWASNVAQSSLTKKLLACLDS
jgi:DNA-binding transcriptional LysR family regulator